MSQRQGQTTIFGLYNGPMYIGLAFGLSIKMIDLNDSKMCIYICIVRHVCVCLSVCIIYRCVSFWRKVNGNCKFTVKDEKLFWIMLDPSMLCQQPLS